ncbi:MAG: arsenate reductase ArsC [Ramlibacter sp.]
MSDKVFRVLFICSENSARSIMAEGLLNDLGRGRFKAFSAGSRPSGAIHPLAISTLEKLGVPAAGFRSKSWDEFADSHALDLDFVLTVCNAAAGEPCPVWPGRPVTANWSIPDPAAVHGSDEQMRRAFLDAAAILKRRIEYMLLLPMEKLDRMSLQREVSGIGQR